MAFRERASSISSAWNIKPSQMTQLEDIRASMDQSTPPSDRSVKGELGKYMASKRRSLSPQPYKKFNSHQIQMIGQLLPDTLMKMIQQRTLEEEIFAIIFACDMSGFHTLAEKFKMQEPGSLFRLTSCINNFMGTLIEVIYHYKGDVLKISGDSLMAMWPLDQNVSMEQILHKAIECSLYIQQNLGSFQTEVGIELEVKIGISAGNITIRLVGTPDFGRSIFMIGQPIVEAKYSEMLCEGGDVIISPTAWGLCTSFLYEYTLLDKNFVKIKQIIPSNITVSSKDDTLPNYEFPGPIEGGFVADLRKTLQEIRNTDNILEFSSFVLPFILKQIKYNRAFEIVSEMRYVTISIIRIQINPNLTKSIFLSLCNESFTIVSRQIKAMTACLTKIYNYDNDILFFTVFGLRGYLGPPSAMASLRCSYQIHKELLLIKNINTATAAISTGYLYCGLMGHPDRKEYSVIGFPVVRARKMLLVFPTLVVCDRPTYQHSRLPEKRFTKKVCSVEHGTKLSGIYFSYMEVVRKSFHVEKGVPLFDRQDEMNQFKLFIEKDSRVGLIIYGEEGSGKSRLLEEFSRTLEEKNKTTLMMNIQSSIIIAPFSAIKYVFDKIIQLDNTIDSKREICLAKLINSNFIQIEDLCYLNTVLDVHYPESLQYQYDTPRKRLMKCWNVFKGLVKSLEPKNLALLLDNGENIDNDSWNFIAEMTNCNNTIVVVAINSFEDPYVSPAYRNVKTQIAKMTRNSITKLDSCWLAPLACQILGVQAIDRYLERILMTNSDGNPKWCETFLISQTRSKGIRIHTIHREDLNPVKYVSESMFKGLLTPLYDKPEVSEHIKVAYLVKKINIIPRLLTKKLENIFLIIFDDMSPYEQQLIKCSAVIGPIFCRELLCEILPQENELLTTRAIMHLYELNMFVCGSIYTENVIYNYISCMVNKSKIKQSLKCHCESKRPIEPEYAKMPKYAFCKIIKYSTIAFHKGSYDLLSDEQKTYFHNLIAETLIINEPLCFYCKGLNKDQRKHSLLPPNTIQDIITTNHLMKKYSKDIKKRLNIDKISPEGLDTFKPFARELLEFFGLTDEDMNKPLNKLNQKGEKFKLKFYFHYEFRKAFGEVISFIQCECIYIQANTFEAIYYHYKCANLLGKCIYYLLESTKKYVRLQNLSRATNQLKTAYIIIKILPPNEKKYYLGVYNMLLGMINNQEWHLKVAMSRFIRANSYLKCKFNKSSFLSVISNLFYKMIVILPPIPDKKKVKNRWGNEAANNLNQLYGVFMKLGKYILAMKASIWALIYTEASNGPMELHCNSMANIIEVSTYLGQIRFVNLLLNRKLADNSITIDKANSVEPLIALGKFHSSLFLLRFIIGKIKEAIIMASFTLRIGSRTPRNTVILFVLPLMVQALMMNGQIEQCVIAMRQLSEYYCDFENAILTANVWYHALNLDLILDSGFQNIHIHEILQFSQNSYEEVKTLLLLDQDAKTRLFANVWLYYVRRGNWNEAKKWCPTRESYEYTGTFSNLLTYIKYLEGTIIKITSMSFADSQDLKLNEMHKMRKLLKLINQQTKIFKVLRPRYIFLKAYLKCLQNKMKTTKTLVNKALKLCVQMENIKDLNWIRHNYYLWTNMLNVLDRDFWIEHSNETKNMPIYLDFPKVDWMRVMYTLPVMHTQDALV